VVGRSMASLRVSPFGRRGKMAIRPFTPFPPPPLRFRTAGFPQYGSKRAVSRDLRCTRNLYAATVAISPKGAFCSVIGLASGGTPRFKHNSPVQWPLAPPAVVLSASLVAYYDHIRASAGHDGFISLSPPPLDPQKVPNLLCQSLFPCRRPYSGGSSTPTDEPAR
jgi:hypothetical protein